MTADVPEAPQEKPHWWRVFIKWYEARPPVQETLTIHYAADEHKDIVATGFDPMKVKPRRKGLGPKQLNWCRRTLKHEGAPIFADMERASKAAKGGWKAGK